MILKVITSEVSQEVIEIIHELLHTLTSLMYAINIMMMLSHDSFHDYLNLVAWVTTASENPTIPLVK